MHPFPTTASAHLNHELDTALAVLRAHRIDCCANGRCFHVPSGAIQRSVGIAGSAVNSLLRAGASKSRVHPEDYQSPWLDILGIFAIETGATPAVVLAFGSSSGDVANHLIESIDSVPNTTPLAGSEKMRLLNRISELADRYEHAVERGKTDMHALSERIQYILGSTMVALQSPHKTKRSPNVEAKSLTNSGLFFVCASSGFSDVAKHFATAVVPIVQVASLPEFISGTLPNWRAVLGSGWLPRIDAFEKALRLAVNGKNCSHFVPIGAPDAMRNGPAELAVSAAAKFVTFGWLPQQWSSSSVTGNKFKPGRFVKTSGGAMTDGDITVINLPRTVFPGEEELRIATPEERLESSWLQFQTPFSADEVCLLVDHNAYGGRADRQSVPVQLDTAPRNLLPLGYLHPTSLGILRCIFPSLRIEVIGYSSAASTTTHSAVLERILRLAKVRPDDSATIEMLRNEINALRSHDRPDRPKTSPHSRCIELDGRLEAAEFSRSSGGRGEGGFPSSWPGKLLRRLLEAGRSGRGPTADLFAAIIRVAALLIRVDPKKLRTLILDPDGRAINELRVVRALFAIIRSAAAGDPDVIRTKGSRWGHLALRKELAVMLRELAKGRLAAPPLLAEWVTENVRLTCVMPLDPLEPSTPPSPIESGLRPLPGGFQSFRHYPRLFSANPTSSTIAVDVSHLLHHAMLSLAAGDDTKPCGWLANKISQANELTVAMMVRTGHVEDFRLGDLLSPKTPKDIRSMLSAVPSQLLVRCILLDDAGRELLIRWCEEISRKVACHWHAETEDPDGINRRLTSETQSLLAVFGDMEGMAAAALDCCRKRLRAHTVKNPERDAFQVYFLPDELVNLFRKPVIYRSRGTRPSF